MRVDGDYISREAAFAECDWYANEFSECEYAIMPLKGALEILPAADVRPVVLCRDCIFRSNEWTGCPKLNGTITYDEFFCKCGIKREES